MLHKANLSYGNVESTNVNVTKKLCLRSQPVQLIMIKNEEIGIILNTYYQVSVEDFDLMTSTLGHLSLDVPIHH